MAHYIQGFVALLEPLRGVAVGKGWAVVPLEQDFGFLPVSKQMAGSDSPLQFEGFERLTTSLHDWAVDVSLRFPLAYIETEYFGGVGAQSAIAWQNRQVIEGPVIANNISMDGPINRTLRRLGVVHGNSHDEFDTLGLGRYRSNDQWLGDR
jgi:hypothetical protein